MHKNPNTPRRRARRWLSVSSHNPQQSPGRRITLMGVAAVAGIVAAIAAAVSAVNDASDLLPPIGSGQPLVSELLILDLQNSPIPQISWNANAWKASHSVADVAVECRMATNQKTGCRKGFPVVYHALPNVNGGAEMGRADADPTRDRSVCERAHYDRTYLPISEAGYYCLRTPTRLVGIRPESLPPANETITVRIYATAWEYKIVK